MCSINNHIVKKSLIILSLIFLLVPAIYDNTEAAMEDYCIVPPFVGATIPPLVMLVMGRDHKLYYEAYNDVFDYNDDGILDTTYTHSVDYYGYFDSYKCYEYDTTGTDAFVPVSFTADKFCGPGQWSGNILNWITMSRMDALRKVIYGGYRGPNNTYDSSSSGLKATLLERAYIPQDAHSWGKEFTGRLCNNGSTYTNQCYTAADCDIGTQTGFSCDDMSEKLIGMAGPTETSSCTATPVAKFCSMSFLSCNVDADCGPAEECVYSNWGQVLVSKYSHSATINGCTITDHASLATSYEPQNLLNYYYVSDFWDNSLNPSNDGGCNDCNIFATTEFQVWPWEVGNWQFAIDGDDAVEIEIDGSVVASFYGCHGRCWGGGPGVACDAAQYSGNVSMTEGFHKVVVRHFDDGGADGVRVWYQSPFSGGWQIFGDSLNIMSPNIIPGNECSIKHQDFIDTGDPYVGSIISGGGTFRHLFCNTTLSDGGTPIMRLLLDRQDRIWQWASKEGKACDSSLGGPTDYEVRVAVCVDGLLEENCREYKNSPPLKPAGLMQKYGENANEAVCSKNFNSCITDSDCSGAFEVCVDRAEMFFGLLTGSYNLHQSGGLVRWNIDEVAHAVDNQKVGQLKDQGILKTLNNLKITGYNYSSSSYSSCGWNTTGPPPEGNCEMWGNPIGEMIYEGLRYFAGRPDPADPDPTPEYSDDTYLSGTEGTLGLPNMSDITKASEDDDWVAPYEKFPICSKPFLLVLSDVSPSYDSDQLPGVDSNFDTGFTELPGNTLPGFDASTYTDVIGTEEGIDGGKYFIGQSGTTDDSICSEKTVTSLSSIRGLCPEEPSKQGSYYSAGAAYYGKTDFSENNESGKRCTGTDTACASDADCTAPSTCEGNPIPDVTTYAVAMASPVPTIEMKVGTDIVTVVPVGTSVSDSCGGWGGIANTTYCANRCTFNFDADGLHISNCSADSFCNGNQIVDFYAEAIRDDYGRFRINYEDVAEGADHDMDAIVEYEYCVGSACSPALSANEVKVKLVSTYASGCIDQALGFVISGTTEDGTYIVVKDADSGGGSPIATLGTQWEKVFTVTGVASAKLLKDPLWYAAKWGGFRDTDNPPITDKHCDVTTTQSCGVDTDCPAGETCVTTTINDPGYNKPDKVNEWDDDGDGNPDTYFFVSNPLKLEQQLERAFLDILRRASSGTAVSVLASGEERGANMLQAVFYPVKRFGDLAQSVDITWTGRMQNLWFYLDPDASVSNVREDTGLLLGRDRVLKLDDDYITMLYFDTDEGKTRAWRCHDTDGDGDCDDTSPATIDFEALKNLWEVGELLFVRDPDTRVIYTNIGLTAANKDDKTLDNFSVGLDALTDMNTGLTVPELLDVSNATLAQRVINYVRGVDYDGYCSTTETTVCSDASDCPVGESCIPYRKRTATMLAKVCSTTTTQGCTIDADCPMGETCTLQSVTNTWKLGDIISSTPKIVSDIPINDYQNKYNDYTYRDFIESDSYKSRQTVIAGANDGMLHAIKLGDRQRIRDYTDPTKVAALIGQQLGEETWAFIPKHSLPYLKHLMDEGYCHFYFQDSSPYLVDASINVHDNCTESLTNYNLCNKVTTLDSNQEVVYNETSWRTIVIGSMRIGGACVNKGDPTADPASNVETPVVNVGFSAYYALDITENLNNPAVAPELLWEFVDPNLGFSTTFPVIMRVGDKDKNGKWYVVLTSGPTGPIDNASYEFKGTSDQDLRIYILDLAGDGEGNPNVLETKNVTTMFPGIANAFGNTSFNSAIDIEYGRISDQNYQDDVVYLGYTRMETMAGKDSWTKGGMLRMLTHENLDPATWTVSEFIRDTGPITSSMVKARDESGAVERLWIYFGEGRYDYKTDDEKGLRRINGLVDPCYENMTFDMALPSCHVYDPAVDYDDTKIKNATFTPYDAADPIVMQGLDQYLGWFINLDCAWDTPANECDSEFAPTPYNAERVITHPLAVTCGSHALVYVTSFSPTGDLCGYGGLTYLWALDHATGGPPDPSCLVGKALIQVSTGEIKEIDLKEGFTEKKPTGEPDRGRRTAGFKGVPPTGQGLSIITMPEATKRIIHMQER
jgi:type IV pilus assembly protein PilY1